MLTTVNLWVSLCAKKWVLGYENKCKTILLYTYRSINQSINQLID